MTSDSGVTHNPSRSLRDWQYALRDQLRALSDQPEQETRWLLAAALGLDGAALLRDALMPISAEEEARITVLLTQRLAGVPLAYCLGEWSFYGLDLCVAPAVLIPRPDTETLVTLALEGLAENDAVRVLDLGTGSGAIALAIAQARPLAEVWAVERSPAALQVARANGALLAPQVHWLEGDWYAPLDSALRFNRIVANPPYLADNDSHLPDLRHEPWEALVAGPIGLECLERIIAGAYERLSLQGVLLLEHGPDQGKAVRDMLNNAGFGAVQTCRDLAGRERVSSGTRN
ncbi:peptide chain release factor N(5)-glutamine methyltransferase [Acidithiobacillus ferriphilus]|uniref:peptide chain release factor N(5)-glutamine methyltransferase n=1 Tax=Acidithiobacillus ferriphilus TaxID=1689834 RepID=UPI001C07363E|nr:peptide chain release factor N(5)-glutamine methyltransferase [Acidithiobacillus ferriphilus]MBU2834151.1 peptide chain release factor N(5)-glutamine methyltransferase [Acidithiobacillus ferriphilus]